VCPEPDSLEEIDQALKYALETRARVRDSKKPIVNEFINDLLDARIEASK
jgi:predicted ATP-dependent Lon-type protease